MKTAAVKTFVLLFLLLFHSPLLAAPAPLSRLQLEPNSIYADLLVLQIYEQYPQLGEKKTREALQQVLHLPKLTPLARARANYLLAKLNADTGNPMEANRAISELGFITDWQFAGSFTNESNSGLATAFEIEMTDERSSLPVCTGNNVENNCSFSSSWLSRHLGETIIAPLFSAQQHICVYAQTTLQSESRQNASLYFGSGAQSKIFLNGRVIFEDANEYGYESDLNRFDIPVVLDEGDNVLTLKNCVGQLGVISFFARIESDAPYRINADSFEVPILSSKDDNFRKARIKSVHTLLRDAAAAAGTPAYRKGYFAEYAMLTGGVGIDHMPRDMAEVACKNTSTWRFCHALANLTDDTNLQRWAYEQVLQKDPNHVDATAALLDLDLHTVGAPDSTERLILFAAAHPENERTACTLLLYYADAFPRKAMTFRTMLMKSSDAPAIKKCVAESLVEHPSYSDALKYLQRAQSAYFGDIEWHLRTLPLLAAQHPEAATAALETIKDVGAPRIEQMLRLLNETRRVKNTDRQNELWEELQSSAPHVWQYTKEAGLHFFNQGDYEKGILFLRRALEMQPQNPELTQLLAYLDKSPPFYSDYVVPIAQFRGDASVCNPTHDACQLVQNLVYKVHFNGLSSKFIQTAVRVNTRLGAKQWQQYSEQFSSNERLELIVARIIHQDGTMDEATGRATFSVSEPWYRLYYDIEAEMVELPSLNPGDIVEFQFRIDDVDESNRYEGYFGTVVPLQSDIPLRRWQTVVIHPKDVSLYRDIPDYVTHQSAQTTGGDVAEIFTADRLTAIQEEPLTTGVTSLVDYLHVSTYNSWAKMRRWYMNLVRAQLSGNAELSATARSITAGKKSEREKIAAIYNWVTQHIRYVGLEFGIHGYKPYPTSQILTRGFGDCKDTASLIVSMLNAVGIEANMALVRTRSAGNLRMSVPSLSIFNHAIAYVPEYRLWLDGTAKYHGSGELPFEDQGVAALVIAEGTDSLTTTPTLSHTESTYTEQQTIRIDRLGNAEMESAIRATGAYAPWFRSKFSVADAKHVLETELAEQWTGIQIRRAEFSDLNRLEEAPQATYAAHVPGLGIRGDQFIRFLSVQPLNLQKKYASIRSRTHDLSLGPLKESRVITRYGLPDGYRLKALPSNIEVKSPFGKLLISFESAEDALVVTRTFRFDKIAVTASEYDSFVRFCVNIDKAMVQEIEAVRK